MKQLRYIAEAIALSLLFAFFRMLPLTAASNAGGAIARTIGPFMFAHRTAKRNLRKAFPDMPREERQRILRDMWDNLGRVTAEMPHLPSAAITKTITCKGSEHMVAHKGKTIMFFSAHTGNWELLPYVAESYGIPIALAYRLANNPYVDRMVSAIRATRTTAMFAKGPQGGLKLLRAIKSGISPAMLVDQKMNTGIAVPFFGREAMTATAIAELALRYDLPIIPARVIRKEKAQFEVIIYPPLDYQKTGDQERDVLHIMTRINQTLESWIRECPEQWFWVHKRWPSERI